MTLTEPYRSVQNYLRVIKRSERYILQTTPQFKPCNHIFHSSASHERFSHGGVRFIYQELELIRMRLSDLVESVCSLRSKVEAENYEQNNQSLLLNHFL